MRGFSRPKKYLEHAVSSGNVLLYRIERGNRKGGVRAKFRNDPSQVDITEAMGFVKSLQPEGTLATLCVVKGDDRAKSILENFVYGGTSN